MLASSSQRRLVRTTSNTSSNGGDVVIDLGDQRNDSRVDSVHEPLLPPGSESDPRETWVHPKLTGYRAIVITLTASFGVSKAILASMGHSIAPTALECIFGVLCTIGLYWLGFYETNCPRKMHWLFMTDYLPYVTWTNTMFCIWLICIFTGVLIVILDFVQGDSESEDKVVRRLLYIYWGAYALFAVFVTLGTCFTIAYGVYCLVKG